MGGRRGPVRAGAELKVGGPDVVTEAGLAADLEGGAQGSAVADTAAIAEHRPAFCPLGDA